MTNKFHLTFDVDLHLLWTGTYHRTALGELSRGEFGLKVGLPRVLEVLKEENVSATFFIPGKIGELFPNKVKEIHDAGHEVAVHGYAHERWNELSYEEEYELIKKSKQILENITGQEIEGFRSPAWSLNDKSVEILKELDFKYDSSLMANDYELYPLRTDDYMTLDGELHFGEETDLIEIPVSWELDDFPYFCFTGKNVGLRSTKDVLECWKLEVDSSIKFGSYFTLTMHPQIIGRGPRILMLQELIQYIKSYKDIKFITLKEAFEYGRNKDGIIL
jgi:peptidoglycan/xylan/chitin deacetylase (PgdA/CDA1 family)